MIRRYFVTLMALPVLVQAVFSKALAQESGTIQATVEIREQLLITSSAVLDFGQVRPCEVDGTVVVTTSNDRFATGCVETRGPKFSRAEFAILGEPGVTYNIVPGLTISVHDQRPNPIPGVTSLDVVNLVSYSTTVGAETTTGQIGPNGIDSIYIGGTLLVPPTALNGSYSGSVELVVNY